MHDDSYFVLDDCIDNRHLPLITARATPGELIAGLEAPQRGVLCNVFQVRPHSIPHNI